jgi:hypothetical protein
MKLVVAAFGALLALSAPATAHGPSTGANGGRQVDAGAYHIEMVAQGSSLTIYVSDRNDSPVETNGFRGTAVLTIDGRAQRVTLTPAGENRLTGMASAPLPAQPRGVVQVSGPAGTSMQARFD